MRKIVNPWSYQDRFGYVQGIVADARAETLYCAGQTSVDADGAPLHKGDMEKQVAQAIDNLETVLTAAGGTLSDVVRLNYYVTDLDAFLAANAYLVPRLEKADCRATSTLLGVARLFHPDILFEVEATAVLARKAVA